MVIVVIMRIGEKLEEVVHRKGWKTRSVVLGYFTVFLFLLALISSPSSSDTPSITKTTDAAYIKKGFISAASWDSDLEADGIDIRLKVYDGDDIVLKEEGTLEVVLYERRFDSEYNAFKGVLLDSWKVQVTKDDYDQSELTRKLEYHRQIPENIDFGWVDIAFIAKDGTRYRTHDNTVWLKI